MNKDEREGVIYDLGHAIYTFLEEEEYGEVGALVSESNCTSWGLDTFNDLETWVDDEGGIGFYADLVFSGEVDEERYALFDSLKLQVKGHAHSSGGEWQVADCSVLTIERSVPDDDYDYDYYIRAVLSNENYFSTFADGIARLTELNGVELPNAETQKTLRRQVFSGAITCLETYLCDALMNKVLRNPDLLESFFLNFKFDEKRIDLKELVKFDNILEEIAKREMSRLMYHNLEKINEIYKSVLGVDFPDFAQIGPAVSIRHDLIHRNGRTFEGAEHEIGKDDVENVVMTVERFVRELNDRIERKDDIPF
jgi:hypothetical protein